MRRLFTLIIVLGLLALPACTTPDNVYLRNISSKIAIVEVFLLDKQDMKTLPNKVKIANQVVEFKGDYKKYLNKRQNVIWLDTVHFKFELMPNTTADLTDMAGSFVNSHPRGNFRVTVSVGNKVDTLVNGWKDFRYQLFQYKGSAFGLPVLYYDAK